MAQPSVAREPSMEEILASIRKIIESNDVGPDRTSAGSGTLYSETEMDEGVEPSLDDQIDAATLTFDAANDAAPVIEPVAPEPKAVSLADLAARVRATVQRSESAVPAAPASESSPLMTSRLASLRSSTPPLRNSLVEPDAVSAPPVVETRDIQAEPMIVAPDLRIELSAEAIDLLADAATQNEKLESETSETMEDNTEAATLLSAASGALVAQSFSDLAAAIDGQQRRSLDEMAEELLRPMLREWLDDNLPTLVERLVREEIERVVRGPRR